MSIQDMKTNDEILIEYLKAEIKELKDKNYHDEIKDLHKERDDSYKAWKLLKEDNKRLNRVNSELCEKIEGLKSSDDVRKLRINRKKYEKLQAELDKAIISTQEMDGMIMKLEDEKKDLAIACRVSKDTSHYPKEYKEEAEMYFHHNPNTEKLWFFMVGDSEVDEDGDIRTTLNVGVDAIAECDNLNGDVGLEVYK